MKEKLSSFEFDAFESGCRRNYGNNTGGKWKAAKRSFNKRFRRDWRRKTNIILVAKINSFFENGKEGVE